MVPSISCTSGGRSSLWRTMAIGGTSQTIGENTTRNADLAVGVDHDVGVGIVERDQPQHVLHAGDAAADRFQRADQRARPHLLLAAVGAHRQRVEQPHFQRQLLEQAAAERVVGMVVRVDQAGDDELAARIDHLCVVGREIGADRDDVAVLDQDVGDLRLVDVAVVVVDLAAADQQFA